MPLSSIRHITVTAALAAGLVTAAFAQDVTGAGATFPAPIYAKWADAYHKASGARINYQSIGSGAGIQQIKARTVDFGASDMPLKDEELAKRSAPGRWRPRRSRPARRLR
jgi:phosphate transport system substrate-binding protein